MIFMKRPVEWPAYSEKPDWYMLYGKATRKKAAKKKAIRKRAKKKTKK
jgi:hypothetical protein